jgi:hypothetical protein
MISYRIDGTVIAYTPTPRNTPRPEVWFGVAFALRPKSNRTHTVTHIFCGFGTEPTVSALHYVRHHIDANADNREPRAAPEPFSRGPSLPSRSQLSAPHVPPSPFGAPSLPSLAAERSPMCPLAVFGAPSLPSLAAEPPCAPIPRSSLRFYRLRVCHRPRTRESSASSQGLC